MSSHLDRLIEDVLAAIYRIIYAVQRHTNRTVLSSHLESTLRLLAVAPLRTSEYRQTAVFTLSQRIIIAQPQMRLQRLAYSALSDLLIASQTHVALLAQEQVQLP